MEKDSELVQKNSATVQRESKGRIEIIQTNTCTFERELPGEIEIRQVNSSIIKPKKQNEKRNEKRPEYNMDDNDSNVLVVHIKDLREKEINSPVLPIPFLNAMELLAGDIREHLGNQNLKKNLLNDVKHSRELLQSGRMNQALYKLTIVGDEVQRIANLTPPRQKPVDLIQRDLIKTQRQLFDLV